MLTETQLYADHSAIENAANAFKNDVLNGVINADDYEYRDDFSYTHNFVNWFTIHHGYKWLVEDGDIIIDFLTEEKKSEFITKWS